MLIISTKEIMSITYQSAESVKKTRHRLRKKINIDSEQELSEFFQHL